MIEALGGLGGPGLENSGIVDSEHGKAILISVSARKFFRNAFPNFAHTKNYVMNPIIAKMFSEGRIIRYFKPKQMVDPTDVGEIRNVGGAKVVAIINDHMVRVIAVKGTPAGFPQMPPVNPFERAKPGPLKSKPEQGGVEKALEQGI